MDVFESLPLKVQVKVIYFLLVTQTKKWHTVYKLLKRLFNEYVNSR